MKLFLFFYKLVALLLAGGFNTTVWHKGDGSGGRGVLRTSFFIDPCLAPEKAHNLFFFMS